MFNKIILVGNLTRDIELRYAQSGGLAIANTAIATTRKFTSNGEKKEEVCFVDITFFGRSAEVANQYLRKGSKILVEGRLKLDQWVDQSGNKRSKHSVTVETMQMLDSKGDNQGGGNYNAPTNTPTQGQAQSYQQPAAQQQSYQQPAMQQQPQQGYQQQQSQAAQSNQAQQQSRQMPSTESIPSYNIDDDEIPF